MRLLDSLITAWWNWHTCNTGDEMKLYILFVKESAGEIFYYLLNISRYLITWRLSLLWFFCYLRCKIVFIHSCWCNMSSCCCFGSSFFVHLAAPLIVIILLIPAQKYIVCLCFVICLECIHQFVYFIYDCRHISLVCLNQ